MLQNQAGEIFLNEKRKGEVMIKRRFLPLSMSALLLSQSVFAPVMTVYGQEEEPAETQAEEDPSKPAEPALSDLISTYHVVHINAYGSRNEEVFDFEEGQYEITPVHQNDVGKYARWEVEFSSKIQDNTMPWGDERIYHYLPEESHSLVKYTYTDGEWVPFDKGPVCYSYFVIPPKPETSSLKVNVVYQDEDGNTISSEEKNSWSDVYQLSDIEVDETDHSAYMHIEISDPSSFGKPGYTYKPETSLTGTEYRYAEISEESGSWGWKANEPLKLVFTRKPTVGEDGNPLQPEQGDLLVRYSVSIISPIGPGMGSGGKLSADQYSISEMTKNAEGKWTVTATSLITPEQMSKRDNQFYLESRSSMSCTYVFENGEWILPEREGIFYVYMQYAPKPELKDLKVSVVTEDQDGNVLSSTETAVQEQTAELSEIIVDEEELHEYIRLNIKNPEAYGKDSLKFSSEKSVIQGEYKYGYTDEANWKAGWIEQKQAKLVFVKEEKQFSDVDKKHWAYDIIAEANRKGIMTGLTETEFGPLQPMTRGMVATVLYRLAGSPEVKGKNPFSDVPEGAYFDQPITWCYQNGIVRGYNEEQFAPGDLVSRQQIAVMVRNYLKYSGKDVSGRADLSRFKDEDKVSAYAVEALEFCVNAGIISGAANGTLLNPGMNASRAECAKIFLLASEF